MRQQHSLHKTMEILYLENVPEGYCNCVQIDEGVLRKFNTFSLSAFPLKSITLIVAKCLCGVRADQILLAFRPEIVLKF